MLQAAAAVAAVTLTPKLSSDWPTVTAIVCKNTNTARTAKFGASDQWAEIAITQASNGELNIASVSAKIYGLYKARLAPMAECVAAKNMVMNETIVCIDGQTVQVQSGKVFVGEGNTRGKKYGEGKGICEFQTSATTATN